MTGAVGHLLTRESTIPTAGLRPRAPPDPGADPARRLRRAGLEQRLRAAVRVLGRRGVALREPRRGDVLAGPRPGLLPEPGRLHVPDLRPVAGDVRAARAPVRPRLRQ